MKANVFTKYGDFKSLQFKEVAIPTPEEGQVLIKLKNASFNALDWHVFRGVTLVKFKCGFGKPKEKFRILGADISGEVVETGLGVTRFKKGDEVFGDIFVGGFGEYTLADQNKIIHKPKELSHEQAAAAPVAGMTALQALKRVCQVKAGDKVLINGASGGVGSYAVLFAKAMGAEVTAVASEKNRNHVQSLGADAFIDYNTTDFCTQSQKYDWILEVAGNRSPKEIKNVLKPSGKCAVIGFYTPKHLIRYMLSFSKKVKMVSIDCTTEGLEELATMLVEHNIYMPISHRFKLENVAEGVQHLSKKRVVGKMVVQHDL